MKQEVELGRVIKGLVERDAVHVAVAPVVLAENMPPGHRVTLNASGEAVSPRPGQKVIGIVDPFLPVKEVKQNEKVWLLLLPNTITSLRHDWTHPAFEKAEPIPDRLKDSWLIDYAAEFDMSAGALIEAAKEYLRDGESHCLNFDTPDCAYDEQDLKTFWTYYEQITGEKVPDKTDSFVRCAC